MKKRLLLSVLLLLSASCCLLQAANIIPTTGTKYYIVQAATKSAKVVGTTSFNETVITNVDKINSQLFEFVPVSGKTDTYYIKSAENQYLINSTDNAALTEYADAPGDLNTQWMVEGTALTSVRLRAVSSGYLATTDIIAGSALLCDKTATDALGLFKLVPDASMIQGGLIDPGFENAVVEGAPLGPWSNDLNATFGNDNATTQNYRSRIIANGYQITGSNAFLARFYGDANSYNRVSYKLTGLAKGATYQFGFNYKQSNVNTVDATVLSYVSAAANATSASAIGTIFTTTPPTTIATTQTPGSGSMSFVAPTTECYVVWAKNPATTQNFLFYIDDMVLTKTAEPARQISTSATSLTFDNSNRTTTLSVTGALLTDSIRITAPDGIVVTPKALSPSAAGVVVTVAFKGFVSMNGNITLTSGDVVKNIPLTTTYVGSFVSPTENAKYYAQQRTGGKVLARRADGTAALKYAEKEDPTQELVFKPVPGRLNTYYIVNGENKYLSKSTTAAQETLMKFTDNVVDSESTPGYSEWVMQGTSDTLVYITQGRDASLVIGSDSIINNKTVYNNKLSSAANSAFCLQKISVLNTGSIFDPDFENAPIDGGPLGTWIPSNDPIQLGVYGYSRIQGGNGWASTGKKCMYLRFLGEATSYNSISQKLVSLNPGSTYQLDFQYKSNNTSTTALVNVYAATAPNVTVASAINSLYTSSTAVTVATTAQTPKKLSYSFVAPASSVYIVYAKQTAATNFNFYIDNLVLTETKSSGIANPTNGTVLNAYRNGNQVQVDCTLRSAGKAIISILNLQGMCLFQQPYDLLQGENSQKLNCSLATGIYLIKVSINGSTSTQKIVL